tara:strand:+ start:691 stop:978 length:288 start_codon:yes stop_codon:yes gene_type:complete
MKNPILDENWYKSYCKLEKFDRPDDEYIEGYKRHGGFWKFRLIRQFIPPYYYAIRGRTYLSGDSSRENAVDYGEGYMGPFFGSEMVGFRICRNKS